MIIYEKNDLRVSLITSRLLRTEKRCFTDLPTQTVCNRDFDKPSFELSELDKYLIISTDRATFKVRKSTGMVISVSLDKGAEIKSFKNGRLPGTYRTLDNVNGSVGLEKGITSTSGASVIDDSKGLLISEKGELLPRPECKDLYWFAYGHNYLEQLRDFFRLTGEVPLIPKYALGNWWSRYKAYTQKEYLDLMQTFVDKKLPITVATIDMDWHWTDVISRFGKDARSERPKCLDELFYYYFFQGWTGYSWNRELFPDYKELLSTLHEKGFHVTLNVHPSQGVRYFEDGYVEMCKRLGEDPKKKGVISFDVGSPRFMEAYFEVLHHPYEEDGVDFWWIDWQQGRKSSVKGLDPLWALNHYHTLDSARADKRPLILSRYSGLGSHRYPLGFSGDTHCTWKSLDFQPYFTNSAANSGYTWWSHDIGGHMHGYQDDELYLRWLQYGVFSPINRLHSSNSDYMGKEPWKRSWAVNKIAEDFLRLRHKLIPYLYTANYKTHSVGEPICMPMYYRYDTPDAYKTRNQYIFGGSLIVCPITKRLDKRLNLAYADVWLPEGIWTDIFNGRSYKGGRWVKMYRDLDSIPVLAPAGAIIPTYKNTESNDLSLSQSLEILIYRGNGEYELYEDDGITNGYKSGEYATTRFAITEKESALTVSITPDSKASGLLPNKREIILKFCDIDTPDRVISLSDEPITVEISDLKPRYPQDREELKSSILTRVQGSNDRKNFLYPKKLPSFVKEALAELDALV